MSRLFVMLSLRIVNMYISDVLSTLKKQTNKKITQSEVASVLGISAVSLNKRISRKSELKLSEVQKLSNYYGYNLFNIYVQNGKIETLGMVVNTDTVEISYYYNPKLADSVKNPLIDSIIFDSQLIHKIWNKDEKNLCTLKMPGDSMDGGEISIKNDDLLILDTSSRNISSSGIYAYTTNDDNFIFVNGIMLNVDGSVRFFFYNKKYPEITYTQAELDNVNFKIIGRVIKNISSLD